MAWHPQQKTERSAIATGGDPFVYLARRREQTASAMRATLGGLGNAAAATGDPALWARTYPWATTLTSFVVGVTAAHLLIPHRGSQSATANREAGSTGQPAYSDAPASPASPTTGPSNQSGRSKLWAAVKSVCWGAAYGLGRNLLSQVLNELLAGHAQAGDDRTSSPVQESTMNDEWGARTAEFQPDG